MRYKLVLTVLDSEVGIPVNSVTIPSLKEEDGIAALEELMRTFSRGRQLYEKITKL